jgi:anti-sigma B factor antagonist
MPPPSGARRPPRVTVTRRTADEADVVVTGDFDVAGTPDVVARLDELVADGCLQIVLDLSGVTFADASALGLLLRTKRRLEGRQGSLRVVYDDNPYVTRLLAVTGLDALLR